MPLAPGLCTCVKFDHEIFSMVILSLPLIQEGSCQFWRKNVHNTG